MRKAIACMTIVAMAACGCGDDGSGGSGATAGSGQGGEATEGGGGAGEGGGTGGTAQGNIPDPGPGEDGEWTDIEPNDTPDQAVPVGTLNFSIWAGFAEPFTAINPEDDVDFFVFQTGGDVSNVFLTLCASSFAGNLLDMYLYDVVDHTQGALVASAESTAAGCETLVAMGQGSDILTPNSVYLLEVRAAPGLALNGDEGLYSA